MNAAVVEQRIQDFNERADVRNLGVLLVGGLLSPFEYVDRLTVLALAAGLDTPTRLN